MLAVNANTRCFVCIEPQDFRKGIDGIAGIVRQRFAMDPMDGALYLFRNRNRTSVKLLFYTGFGFWLCQLRLSSGRLKWWPEQSDPENVSMIRKLSSREIQVMLSNGDPRGAQFAEDWRSLT